MRRVPSLVLTSVLVLQTACTNMIEECFWQLLGTVRDSQTSSPLSEVEISATFSENGDWCCVQLTDIDGGYSQQSVGGDCGPNPRVTWLMRFRKTGYKEQIRDVHEAVEVDPNHYRLDVLLEPE